MPRKRKDAVPEEGTVDTSLLNETAPGESRSAAKPRLSITMKENGEIDFESMRGETKERLQRALASLPQAQGTVAAIPALRVNREFIPTMYDTLAKGIQMAGGMIFGWPEELKMFIAYSDEEKEALTEPTAAVIEKYSSKLTFLLRHQEEFALFQAFADQSQAMVQRAVIQYAKSQPKAEAPEVPEGTSVGEA